MNSNPQNEKLAKSMELFTFYKCGCYSRYLKLFFFYNLKKRKKKSFGVSANKIVPRSEAMARVNTTGMQWKGVSLGEFLVKFSK